ncbi:MULTISPECIES: CPBP family intramembrane glutamic endopeptidase [Pseudonocardia]|uniref:CPBP family intramembrane glutamic endopeptidase n=1 Tax=Pseudonocardia TaxID=1847 RepID=UPI000A2824DF|nr:MULTISPECIES: type II CAAX endopeptidase family protein [Pseudonocardia]
MDASTPGSAHPVLSTGAVGMTIRVLIAVCLLLGANLLVGAATAVLPTPASEAVAVALQLTGQVLVCVLVVAAVWLWCRRMERLRLRDVGWSRPVPGRLLAGTAAGIGLFLAAAGVLAATGSLTPVDGGPVTEGATPVAVLLVVLGQAFLLQAIPEELLFRGWLLTMLRDRPVVGLAVSTVAFTLIHLFSSGGQTSLLDHIAYLAIPFGFGLLAGVTVLVTGSIWAAAGVHGGFHLGTTIVLVGWEVTAHGPLAWTVLGGVYTVAALVLLGTVGRSSVHGSVTSG